MIELIKRLLNGKSDTVSKRKYIALQIEFFVLFLVLLAVLYTNYDYFVFKIMMSFSYSYTDVLDGVYDEELKTPEKGKYFKYFDDLAIKSVMDKLSQQGGDEFSFLYTPDKFKETKENLTNEQVKTDNIDEDTVIIRLPSFVSENITDFKEKMKNVKCRNLVIDLTNNPGGYVDGAVTIADLFLDRGMTVYSERSRNIFYNRTFYSENKKQYFFDNIYILQNKYTASAAEILINALKDNLDNVTLIGSVTYGKGIGQFEYRLKYGYTVKATAVQFYSPKGRCINGEGIMPDIVCTDEEFTECILKVLGYFD